ncbi:MAG TPA: ParB N-terminal domain-containing protein [Anaerolineae bacterium]|nr:ParB N-terminal domain-containing protein [Anaerolineae bacterium]
MSKKRLGLGNLSFNKIDPYGGGVGGDEVVESALKSLHIESIRPDPDQPRQLLPPHLQEKLMKGVISPAAVLLQWRELAAAATAPPALVGGVTAVQQLADSIAQHGLINGITVRPCPDELNLTGVQYLIVTGERRWWAHIWLSLEDRPIQEGNKTVSPDQIRATIVTDGTRIRAHQLIENLLREDISLIEKARGIIHLREELQNVALGQQKVTWQDVEETLGMSRAYRHRIMKVLSLTPEAQEIVTQYQLTERAIRPITEKLNKEPALQKQALQKLVAWQQAEERGEELPLSIPQLTKQLVTQLLNQGKGQKQVSATATRKEGFALEPQMLTKKLQTTTRYLQKLDSNVIDSIHKQWAQEPSYEHFLEEIKKLQQVLNQLLPPDE